MRALKWFAIAVLVLFTALVLFVVFGLNTLKGPISRAVSHATGRELLIEGDLRPVWTWTHPRFRAEKVTLANPEWAREDYMFFAEAVEASVSVLPLLIGRVVLPEVHLQKPEIYLEQTEDGKKNWILSKDAKEEKGKSRVYIKALTFDSAYLKYFDPNKEMDLAAELATNAEGIAFEASGLYQGLEARAAGRGGAVMGLREATTPFPVTIEAKIGDTSAHAEGTITNIAEMGALDLQIDIRGKTMADLYEVVGIAFPETSPYRTAGHLTRGEGRVRYDNFTGKVGESDLAGTIEVRSGEGKRPFMQGDLVSKTLNLADLGSLVGTKQERQGEGVLPDMPFDSDRWNSVDADVKLRAGTIVRPKQLPIENLTTRVVMKDKVLSVDPLEFGVAGGKIVGPIRLDGNKNPIEAQANLRVRGLQLAKLFPTIKEGQASIGAVSGIIELGGSGNSVGEMLGSANGKVGVFVDKGQVSKFVMELVAIDLWGIAKTKLQGDEPVGIRCAIADFDVQKGVLRTNALVFDTTIVNVGGEGSVNLRSEEMDLKLTPKPKERSIASLNSPLYIRGTFANPKVGPDVGKLAVKGVGAVIMGVINPLLAVLPLMKEGKSEDSNCPALIAEAGKRETDTRAAAATSSGRSAASGATAKRPPAKSGR